MANVSNLSLQRKKSKTLGDPQVVQKEEIEDMAFDSRVELIQALIPLGLMHIHEELKKEVEHLAGVRYRRKSDEEKCYRHGTNKGSVRLAGQRIPIGIPRVRSQDGEIRLKSYDRFHDSPGEVDEQLFRRVLYGISCRNYEKAAAVVPGAIGISSSTVSRKFVEASTAKLKKFQERDLKGLDIVALFLDGKTFAEDTMVIAMGVTIEGDKVFLGFVQTDTENKRVIEQFLRTLLDRGLDVSKGLVTVIDGSKGLRSAALAAFKKRTLIQRCQWHKRENVLSYLSKKEQGYWRKRLQKAYGRPMYEEAKQQLLKIQSELSEVNESAASSLGEGFEETLTLHRLGLFPLLGVSLKTTNCLESINAMAEERCSKVDCWKNSKQKHRWLASALLDIEPRLQKLTGYRHLMKLREALMNRLKLYNRKRSHRKVA
jgi:transposase-like protein